MINTLTNREKDQFTHLLQHLEENSYCNEIVVCDILICIYMESLGFLEFWKLRKSLKKLHFDYMAENDPEKLKDMGEKYKYFAFLLWSFLKVNLSPEIFNRIDNACENISRDYFAMSERGEIKEFALY